MSTKPRLLSMIGMGMLLLGTLAAQEPAPTELQKSLNDLEVKGPWNYNDLPTGFAQAKKSGKPLLVVFRCPP
jgi:hypothetical protein